MNNNLDVFSEIEYEKPVDKIIDQIRNLIISGQLKPGDKLPSERMLSSRIGLGRTYVREAIKRLEFYGILKTLPQSGTVVAGIGITALEGLISNILKIEKSDFASLVETRVILEIEAARMAAKKRTEKNLEEMKKALDKHKEVCKVDYVGVGEDFLFHLKIAEASQNPVVKSMLMIITPEIMENFTSRRVCNIKTANTSFAQHLNIYNAIKQEDGDAAAEAMKNHLKDILNYSRSLK